MAKADTTTRDWRVIPLNRPGCNLEVVPPPPIGESWRIRAAQFDAVADDQSRKAVRRFYARQKQIIRSFEEAQHSPNSEDAGKRMGVTDVEEVAPRPQQKPREDDRIRKATNASLILNVLLFVGKLLASILSGSLSVISSLVDSALDLFSGITLWLVSRAMRPKRLDVYRYPTGKRRLEPVAIIVCASVMGTATLQIVSESIQSLADDSTGSPDVGVVSGVFMGCTVIIKFLLFLYCGRIKSPTVQALALDHRNDVASNLAAIVFGLLGTFVYGNADAIGAILIAVYIIVNWCVAGYQQAKMLVGYTASADFLQKLTFLACNHHVDVIYVDTVRAYHFGNHFLVEVHIVLKPEMALREAHDIGESLQKKLELLEDVERAFVHLDFEVEHDPTEEHVYK